MYRSLRGSRHLVERQLVKAQDRHTRRLEGQVEVNYEIGDPVWVYQSFRANRGESRSKKLAFPWHGPYRVVSKVGPNSYKIEVPSQSGKLATVNVNRLKRYRGRWTHPYLDEVPEGVNEEATDVPLEESDLPASSYAERLTVGREDTVIAGVDAPILEIVSKRVVERAAEYLALTANYETFWLPRAELMSEYAPLVHAFEQAERKKRGLPAQRRSARLADANAEIDDDYLLLA
ncbi:hypothetical protein PI124_g516 [Phytophthora idaei]|nr:hypothetical protein PI125_g11094 [Phytophthora idaei]KAG3138388.1 hypothetical protein PI126_g16938 [Phytophthora idaei]KAG3254921.1 hypothetical protein PI124_g516 [Phytophthora idaei]